MNFLKNRKMSGLTTIGFMVVAAAAALFLSANVERAIAGQSDIKIVTVDIQRVVRMHPAFQEAMQEYQRKLQEFQRQMEEIEEDERAMMQQLLQQQMQQLGMQLQDRAFDKMQEDVRAFAKDNGYDYIFDSSVLLAGGIDVTEELLESLGKDPEEAPEMPQQLPLTP